MFLKMRSREVKQFTQGCPVRRWQSRGSIPGLVASSILHLTSQFCQDLPDISGGKSPPFQFRKKKTTSKGSYLPSDTACSLLSHSLHLHQLLRKLEQILFLDTVVQMTVMYGLVMNLMNVAGRCYLILCSESLLHHPVLISIIYFEDRFVSSLSSVSPAIGFGQKQ